MPTTRVALAGATGNLGIPVLEALLKGGFSVIVLSRHGGNASKLQRYQDQDVTICEVDFTRTESILPALKEVEVAVSCLATLAIGAQNPLIDACCAAGVRRFIPAEFGMDSRNALCQQLPVCEPKVATQRYLEHKVSEHPGFTWTGIANGLFLDWGMQVGFIANLAQHTATLYNGGDISFSTTTLSDVATAISGVIQNQELTANRLLYVHSTATTQNKLIQYAKEKDHKDWALEIKDTNEVMQESLAELQKGNLQSAMDGFCVAASWNPAYGCDFSSHLDNELLGIKALDDTGLREIVEKLL
ncbi:hypothetical protein RBB50_005681 [Rhinocladiella similis]